MLNQSSHCLLASYGRYVPRNNEPGRGKWINGEQFNKIGLTNQFGPLN